MLKTRFLSGGARDLFYCEAVEKQLEFSQQNREKKKRTEKNRKDANSGRNCGKTHCLELMLLVMSRIVSASFLSSRI